MILRILHSTSLLYYYASGYHGSVHTIDTDQYSTFEFDFKFMGVFKGRSKVESARCQIKIIELLHSE